DPASCHLLRSSIPLPYGAHWPLPAEASSHRKGSQRAPRQNLTLGALWNASGASAMWVTRGPLAGEIAGAPATSDPGYRIESAALCLAFCVRVSRERRYGLPDNWHSYGCQGDPWDVNYGYDAQKGEFTDLVQAGIIDPIKIVRHARRRLQASCSR